MTVYLDTSFVAPLVIAEPASDAVEAFVMDLPPGELMTSLWTRVELASLVARKLRMRQVSPVEAQAMRREFGEMLYESFDILTPTARDFETAARYLEVPRTGLRAGDALHLATATNHGAERIVSLDRGFVDAGKRLKLPVGFGIRRPV